MAPGDAGCPFHDHLLRVVYRDTDQMGIVYYANYFVYFEIGRVEYLRAKGMSYKGLEERGLRIPVLKAGCEYKRPARYDDVLRVRARLVGINRVRLSFAYEIFRDEDGELLVTGSTEHAFVDLSHRLTRVSAELARELAAPF